MGPAGESKRRHVPDDRRLLMAPGSPEHAGSVNTGRGPGTWAESRSVGSRAGGRLHLSPARKRGGRQLVKAAFGWEKGGVSYRIIAKTHQMGRLAVGKDTSER